MVWKAAVHTNAKAENKPTEKDKVKLAFQSIKQQAQPSDPAYAHD